MGMLGARDTSDVEVSQLVFFIVSSSIAFCQSKWCLVPQK
jgi:hypothetical protein